MDMDYCVCCGRYVPEGTWVCRFCMEMADLEVPVKEEQKPAEGERILIRRKDKSK